MKILKYLLSIVALVLLAAVIWLWVAPPALIRVASAYAAKMVCSNVHLAGRDAEEVLKVDVQAPGHPVLRFMQIDVNANEVKAGLFGLFGAGRAVHQPGRGCTVVPETLAGRMLPVAAEPKPPAVKDEADGLWPQGNRVAATANARLDAVLDDAALQGPNMRAIVVVRDGRIIAERYGAGFDKDTPLLGWSMAKTVTAGLIGILEKQNRLSREAKGLFAEWNEDARKDITVAALMGMASSLEWNEGYGSVSDVTRLLYLEPDMAAFARQSQTLPADGAEIDKVFNYSSGTTVLLTRYWQSLFNDAQAAQAFPKTALFEPLGMASAVMEQDAAGTLTGSSYVYATARDWARYGQFLLQKGVWDGKALLPEGYVDWMVEPHPAQPIEPRDPERPKEIKGSYGRGHIWLRPPGFGRNGDDPVFENEAWWLSGHDGQSIAILPKENLVIVRMGLTPSKLGYKAAALSKAVVEALR